MTKKFNLKNLFTCLLFAIAICCGSFISQTLWGDKAYAYNDNVSVTNLNFNSSGDNVTYLESSISGWNKGISNSDATSGVINVTDIKTNYYLDSNQNIGKKGADNRVLMINSKSEKDSSAKFQYYENSSYIDLSANTNYMFSTWVKVTKNASASIYLVGLDDKYDDMLTYTQINYSKANEWTEYKFYVATGAKSQSVKLQLWLGAKNNVTSYGAVFFDNLSVKKLSNDEMPNSYVDLTDNQFERITNGDFSNGFTNWKQTGNIGSKAGAKIMKLSSSNDLQSVGLGKYYSDLSDVVSNNGYDFTKNNTGALVLYTITDAKQYFGYKLANNIDLKIGDVIKLSVNVKVANISGNAVVTLKEVANENSTNYPVLKKESSHTTLGSESIKVSSNSTNKFLNNYQTVTFYVNARSLYNSELSLELALGSSEEGASGIVVFDNVTLEKVSYEDFKNASTSDYVKKVTLQSISSDLTITNGTFNSVEKSEKALNYPLLPASWTNTTSDKANTTFGVINTNATHFEQNKSNYGSLDNPKNPDGFVDDENETNNILMLWNKKPAYQSAKSSTFSVSAGKYYTVEFDYKTVSSTTSLNVYIEDANGNILFSEENISNSSLYWSKYKMLIKTYDYSSSIKVVIGLGNENNKTSGYLFIDNVLLNEQTDMTEENYSTLIQTIKSLDFMNGNFNLVKDNGTGILTALAYTGKLEVGEESTSGTATSTAGIIIGGNNEFDNIENENNTNTLKNMMVIRNTKKALYSMTGNDKIDLSVDNYYKFSIDIKTSANLVEIDQTNVPDDEKISYGAIFGLSGLENKFTNILSPEWTTYTIYVKATEAKTVYLYFALESANADTAGTVFFDNYKFEKIEASAYNLETANAENKNNILVIGSTETTDDDNNNDNNDNKLDTATIMIAIPSIIFAVAIILALVTALLKHFKIKKWEKRKIAEYDRSKVTGRDAIRNEAEQLRDKQIKDVEAQIEAVKADITKIEEIHKEQLKNQKGTTITREIERDFKAYAKKHTAMSNKVTSLENFIENMKTPEYLLTLQKQVAIKHIKEEKAQKELAFKKNKK